MFIIRKLIKFEMAHKLQSAYTKPCLNLHGHGYCLELFFKSDKLNEDGMVVDFKKVKDKLKKYIALWDHTLVLSREDDIFNQYLEDHVDVKYVDYNPTAENMAKDMYTFIKSKFPILWKVRLHETDTGYAEYYEEESCCK